MVLVSIDLPRLVFSHPWGQKWGQTGCASSIFIAAIHVDESSPGDDENALDATWTNLKRVHAPRGFMVGKIFEFSMGSRFG